MSDGRPRLHIWPLMEGWAWQHGISHPGTRPNTAPTAGDAFEAAMTSIRHAPAVIIYGEIPGAPKYQEK